MKTYKLLMPALVILAAFIFTNSSDATIRTVSVSSNVFSPANISVTVGDTIRWVWSNGAHTTTCNGTSGTTRPAGAAPWDAFMSSGSPTFTYIVTVPGMYHYVCLPHAPEMAGNINAVASSITQVTELVSSYELSQNYPNPFNPVTNIQFSIPSASFVSLKIFNTNGQEVESLVNENMSAGTYKVDWNAVSYSTGVYYYRIEASGFVQTKKMLLIK